MNTRFLTPVKLTKLGVVVCGTLLMGWTRAQTEDQAKGPAREAQMEQRLNDLSARLGLTSAAQAKFKAILLEQFTKMGELSQQSNGDREKTRAEMTQLRAATVQKLKEQGILNDEQLAKFKQMGPQQAASGAAAGPAAAVADLPANRTPLEFPRGTGHRWMVNGPGRGDQRRRPGNNYWSDAPDVVWVDEQGLHLKIVQRNEQWRCSAVGLPEGLGYGKYIFSLAARVDRLDRNVVLGLFTYNGETFKTDANGELDVEISQWGKAAPPHPQICYVVQPTMGGHQERAHKADTTPAERTTHVIEWTPRYIEFRSYEGDGESGKEIARFRFDDTNPGCRAKHPATGEESDPVVIPNPRNKSHVAINLWLVKGQAPVNTEAVGLEAIISRFRFVPLQDAAP